MELQSAPSGVSASLGRELYTMREGSRRKERYAKTVIEPFETNQEITIV